MYMISYDEISRLLVKTLETIKEFNINIEQNVLANLELLDCSNTI
jgi:hypothetical protein